MANPTITKATSEILVWLNELPPMRKAKAATELTEECQALQIKLSDARRSAVRQLRADGWTLAEIGAQYGLSISRVKQIETGTNKPRSVTAQYVAFATRSMVMPNGIPLDLGGFGVNKRYRFATWYEPEQRWNVISRSDNLARLQAALRSHQRIHGEDIPAHIVDTQTREVIG